MSMSSRIPGYPRTPVDEAVRQRRGFHSPGYVDTPHHALGSVLQRFRAAEDHAAKHPAATSGLGLDESDGFGIVTSLNRVARSRFCHEFAGAGQSKHHAEHRPGIGGHYHNRQRDVRVTVTP